MIKKALQTFIVLGGLFVLGSSSVLASNVDIKDVYDSGNVIDNSIEKHVRDLNKRLYNEKDEVHPNIVVKTVKNLENTKSFSDGINESFYNLSTNDYRVSRDDVVLIYFVTGTNEFGVKYGDNVANNILSNMDVSSTKNKIADCLNIEGSYSTKQVQGMLNNVTKELDDYATNKQVINADDLMYHINKVYNYVYRNTK